MNNNSWEQGAGSSELKQLMLKPLQDKFPVWTRCCAPTLRLRARKMLFILFHASMIFGLAVFITMFTFLVNWITGSFCVLSW